MKLKSIALAALAVAALPALAEIKSGLNTDTLGDSEFVLLVSNANGSYAQDLGITVNALFSQLSTTGSFTQSVAGSQWAAFNAFGGTKTTWSIISVQSIADGFAPGETNTWSTRAAGQALGTFQNQQVTDASGNMALHFKDIDNKAVNSGIGQANNRLASAAGTLTYSDPVILNLIGNGFDTRNAIGTASQIIYMTPSNDVSDTIALTTVLKNSFNNPYVANFDGTNVTITAAVPAVPEPSTYAMLAAGLMAVSFVARRRTGK